MKKIVMTCALFALAAGANAETKAERGKRLMDETLAALGGNNFLAVKDRVETGRAYSFYREQLTGLTIAKIYTQQLDRPGASGIAQREREGFGKDEDYYVLFTDKEGYMVTFRGARPLPSDRYTRWVDSTRRNFFYILRHRLSEPGMIFEWQSSTVWQNTPVEIVDIIDSENSVVTVYLHHLTKLPIRQEFVRRDPKTRERFEEVSMFSKFRDVGGGVQWPFAILSERNGEKVFEMFSDTVAINTGLTDNHFVLPGSTKVLPPAK